MSDSESVAFSTLFLDIFFSLVPTWKKKCTCFQRKKEEKKKIRIGRLEIHEADGTEAPVFLCLIQQLRPEYI